MSWDSALRCMRLAPWSGNPLMRRGDRIVSFVAIAAVVTVLVLVPVGALLGALKYTDLVAQSAHDRAADRKVSAVVVDDPAARITTAESAAITGYDATVAWTDWSGSEHRDRIDVEPSTTRGQSVDVWVDQFGNLAPAPKTGIECAALGVCVALGVWLSGSTVAVITAAAVCGLGRKAQLRNWTREWSSLEGMRGWSTGGQT